MGCMNIIIKFYGFKPVVLELRHPYHWWYLDLFRGNAGSSAILGLITSNER